MRAIIRKYREYRRKLYILANLSSSSPFISGDTFRGISYHKFDEISELNPLKIQAGNIVFLRGDFIEFFMENIHPKITNSYKLIVHNSDAEFKITNIDDKIIRVYAQNVSVVHKKITPIPIGLENLHHQRNGRIKLFEKYRSIKPKKSNKIFYAFNPGTNPKARLEAIEALRKNKSAEEGDDWYEPEEYLEKLNSYKFVASPEGNGIDCHRTWEAMYLGTIPILTKSVLSSYFEEIGLPILLIDDWNKVVNLNEDYLEKFYEKSYFKFSSKYLWIESWEKLIHASEDPLGC